MTSGQRQSSNSKKKVIIIATASLAVVILLAVGIVWYTHFYPIMIKNKIFAGMQKIQISKVKGELAFSSGGKTSKATMDGYFNSKDEKNPKADFKIGLDIPAAKDTNVQAEINAKVIGNKVYVKLSKVPDKVGLFDLDLSPIKDKWAYIDTASMKNVAGNEATQVTPAGTKEINKILAEADIYKNFKKAKSEKVDGVDCHKFDFEIDKDKLADTLANALNAQIAEAAKAQHGELKEEDAKANRESVKEQLKDIESIKGSIYSGKKDYLLRKMEVHLKGKDFGVDVSLEYSDIGKEQEVKAPEKYKTFEEIFSELYGSSGSAQAEGQNSANNARIKANAARIQTALEECYSNNQTYPLLTDPCVTSKFDGGIVPKDNINLVIIDKTYTLTADLSGENDLVLQNKQ